MESKPYAAASARNAAAILGVLRHEFRTVRTVLEIGSGTGQHAVAFAADLDHLVWQTSDRVDNHDGIRRWIADAALPNIREPLPLDVLTTTDVAVYDAVYSSNTAHIMSFPAVECLFRVAGRALRESGLFCLYGPFCRAGVFNTPSNEAFDRSLRAQDPTMGIRDLDDLERLAAENGMGLARVYAMPANNFTVIWSTTGGCG